MGEGNDQGREKAVIVVSWKAGIGTEGTFIKLKSLDKETMYKMYFKYKLTHFLSKVISACSRVFTHTEKDVLELGC